MSSVTSIFSQTFPIVLSYLDAKNQAKVICVSKLFNNLSKTNLAVLERMKALMELDCVVFLRSSPISFKEKKNCQADLERKIQRLYFERNLNLRFHKDFYCGLKYFSSLSNQEKSNISSIELSKCRILGQEFESIIKDCYNLESLQIYNTVLSAEALTCFPCNNILKKLYIGKMFFLNSVNELDFNDNVYSYNEHLFGTVLSKCTLLEDLCLIAIPLLGKSLTYFPRNNKLKKLRVNSMNLQDDKFGEALSKFSELEELSLVKTSAIKNSLGCLPQKNKLKYLYLESLTKISDAQITEVLRKCPKLETVILYCSVVKKTTLLPFLQENSNLKKVTLYSLDNQVVLDWENIKYKK